MVFLNQWWHHWGAPSIFAWFPKDGKEDSGMDGHEDRGACAAIFGHEGAEKFGEFHMLVRKTLKLPSI